jgi:hypothetical protein
MSSNTDWHKVTLACPWCGVERLFYFDVTDSGIIRPVRCLPESDGGCGRRFAVRVTWAPELQYWRMLASWGDPDDRV